MKLRLLFLVVFALASVTTSAFAQNSIFDVPPSKNALVNYAVDFLKNNPDKSSLSDFNQAFALQIRVIKNKSVLFKSVTKALEQASQESLEGAQTYLQTGSYGDYFPSSSLAQTFKITTMIQDVRFRTLAISSPLSGGVIGIAMTQLHTLTETEFATFAANYIETLKRTKTQMAETNAVSLQSYVRDELANASYLLEEAPKDKVAKFTESIKASATKRFTEDVAANTTVGMQILRELVVVPVARENHGNLDSTGLKTQRTRILKLMIAAINEGDLFTDAQVKEIADAVIVYVNNDFDRISDKEFQKAMKEAYLSDEVQSLTLELKALTK